VATRPPAELERPGELDWEGTAWEPDDIDVTPPAPRPRRRAPMILLVVVVCALGVIGGSVSGSALRAEPRWLAGTLGSGAVGPVLGPLNDDAPAPSPEALAARIGGLLNDNRLGNHVTASVVDVATGESLFEDGGDSPAVPASTTKLATAAAVLTARGPDYRIATRAVSGDEAGEVILIGGGDPTLAVGAKMAYPGAARLDKLAAQVKKALGGTKPTKVTVDSSLFEGSTVGPEWASVDLQDGYIARITALMTDGARREPTPASKAARYDRPDLAAGQAFAKALGVPASRVTVTDRPTDPHARELGKVLSPTMASLVERTLLSSDNVMAEALARQVALASDMPASFAGGAQATRDALAELGVPTDGVDLVDGSGFSHENHLSTQALTAILALAAGDEHPELRTIISGLPVAAYSGTLINRYSSRNSGKSAAGVVRAKTGTLSGVSALAGIAVDADGRLLAFSLIADETNKEFATPSQMALDQVAAAIAACGCS
jgi:D-alanyl-D-alanine carboxypeptidase/D-alanyl-D-alanine-endopeptidase (penicillin-binding protein 4)